MSTFSSTLFITSFSSTFEVIVECSIGFILTKLGFISADNVRFLSKMWFNLFIPCLFFKDMSTSFSLDLLQKLYLILLFGVVNQILAVVVGKLVFNKWTFRILFGPIRFVLMKVLSLFGKRSQFVENMDKMSKCETDMYTVSFFCHNSVSLPLVYLSALCYLSTTSSGGGNSSHSLDFMNLATDSMMITSTNGTVVDNTPAFYKLTYSEAYERSITALSIFIVPVEIMFYTLGSYVYSHGAEQMRKQMNEQLENPEPTTTEMVSNFVNLHEGNESVVVASEEHPQSYKPEFSEETLHLQEEETPSIEEMEPANNNESSINQENSPIVESSTTGNQSKLHKFKTISKNVLLFLWFNIILNPPLTAIFLACLISVISTDVKDFLIINPPPFVSTIKHLCSVFGQSVAPTSLLILGANIAAQASPHVFDDEKKDDDISSTTSTESLDLQEVEVIPVGERIKRKVYQIGRKLRRLCLGFFYGVLNTFKIRKLNPVALFFSIIIKLIVFPLLGVGLMYLTRSLFTDAFANIDDPLFFLVTLLQFATPPAIAITALSSVNDNYGQGETCEILLWSYLITPLTLSLFCSWFLKLSCELIVNPEDAMRVCNM
ncbi:predicted protein [Naegleria gruberi]|uniref:Predicted protein n=1 Tax=Naegleria gruberi TaxID=5762 RepID=D2VJE5_NAEGR|nr:uncharacterized protein NAEGRDRAFT_69010 [Naegleria gruberi]EFC42929.1 predicted protein [Naegleria gruberi]|eukprot:XP_002675673.1 predicted protein [Naegleria gruberi strain NEG-M]